jgi:curved DNA-binding protein
MEFVDYYKILGVEKNVSQDDIKKAYRKLAREHHPDLNPNNKDAHKIFQQINEANEVLSDPEKRKKYDSFGQDWKHADQFEKAGQSNRPDFEQSNNRDFTGDFDEEGFSDFFESLFGTGRKRGADIKFRGQDYQAELQVNLKDAFMTHQQTLKLDGKNVRITIPAGIENGQKIKLKGYGGPGMNGGPNGDLYISFSILNDTPFKRDGNDLYLTVEISLYTAILGGEVIIETLDGKVKLKISPETQNGNKIRLKGKGFPIYKNEDQKGDLFITFLVKLPSNLTQKQKDLFLELSKL